MKCLRSSTLFDYEQKMPTMKEMDKIKPHLRLFYCPDIKLNLKEHKINRLAAERYYIIYGRSNEPEG